MLVLMRTSPWHQNPEADTSKKIYAKSGNAPVRGEVVVLDIPPHP
jgi:hypothetical protein